MTQRGNDKVVNKLMSISAIKSPAIRAKIDTTTLNFLFSSTVSDVEIPKAQETQEAVSPTVNSKVSEDIWHWAFQERNEIEKS